MADLAQSIDNLLNVVVNYGMQQEAIKREEMRYLERQQQDIDKVNMLGLLESVDKSSTIEQVDATRNAILDTATITPLGKAVQQQVLKSLGSLEHKIGIRDIANKQLGYLEKQFQRDIDSDNWTSDNVNKLMESLRSSSDAAYNAGFITESQRLNAGIKQLESQKRIVDYLVEADENKKLDIFDLKEGYNPNEVAYLEGMFTAAEAGNWPAAEDFAKRLPGARIEYEQEQRYQENVAELTAQKMLKGMMEQEIKDRAILEKAAYQAKELASLTKIRQNVKQASQYSNTGKELALIDKDSDPKELQPIFATQIALIAKEYGDAGSDWSIDKKHRKLVNKAFADDATDKDKIAVAKWLVANPTEVDRMDFTGTGSENITSRHSLELRALIKAYEGTMDLLKLRGIEDETSVVSTQPQPDNSNKKKVW